METAATADSLLDAVLPHVAFDGWSAAALAAGAAELGLERGRARGAGAARRRRPGRRLPPPRRRGGWTWPLAAQPLGELRYPRPRRARPSACGCSTRTARWCAAAWRCSRCRSTPPKARG